METNYTLSIFPKEVAFGTNVFFCEKRKYDFSQMYLGIRQFISELKNNFDKIMPEDYRGSHYPVNIFVDVKNERDTMMLTELIEVKMKNFSRDDVNITAHFSSGINLYY